MARFSEKPHVTSGKAGSPSVGRRDVIRLAGAGGLGLVAIHAVPGEWAKPIVESIIVPLHAQGSPGLGGALYGCGRDGQLFLINILTGAGTLVANLPFGATEIEWDALSGRAWAQQPDGDFTMTEFDIVTGAAIGGPINNNASFTGLEFVGGTLYGAWITESGGSSIFGTLDPATGISVPIGPTGVGPISGLAYNGTMYGVAGGGGSTFYTINMATGAATAIGTTGVAYLGSLEFGPDGNLYAGGGNTEGGNFYRINTATGAATLVGPSGFNSINGLALAAPVP